MMFSMYTRFLGLLFLVRSGITSAADDGRHSIEENAQKKNVLQENYQHPGGSSKISCDFATSLCSRTFQVSEHGGQEGPGDFSSADGPVTAGRELIPLFYEIKGCRLSSNAGVFSCDYSAVQVYVPAIEAGSSFVLHLRCTSFGLGTKQIEATLHFQPSELPGVWATEPGQLKILQNDRPSSQVLISFHLQKATKKAFVVIKTPVNEAESYIQMENMIVNYMKEKRVVENTEKNLSSMKTAKEGKNKHTSLHLSSPLLNSRDAAKLSNSDENFWTRQASKNPLLIFSKNFFGRATSDTNVDLKLTKIVKRDTIAAQKPLNQNKSKVHSVPSDFDNSTVGGSNDFNRTNNSPEAPEFLDNSTASVFGDDTNSTGMSNISLASTFRDDTNFTGMSNISLASTFRDDTNSTGTSNISLASTFRDDINSTDDTNFNGTTNIATTSLFADDTNFNGTTNSPTTSLFADGTNFNGTTNSPTTSIFANGTNFNGTTNSPTTSLFADDTNFDGTTNSPTTSMFADDTNFNATENSSTASINTDFNGMSNITPKNDVKSVNSETLKTESDVVKTFTSPATLAVDSAGEEKTKKNSKAGKPVGPEKAPSSASFTAGQTAGIFVAVLAAAALLSGAGVFLAMRWWKHKRSNKVGNSEYVE
ncbi:hypothetical protein PoB_006018500 [Plakobranchus ocellatus]|uniref:Uncharacterized protein n=1 Tax=Plakobranchus ocellatus TaxID=259542 RepID=A0AAV4CPC7_9GAST|nr:hypothetical protein PoB_006018500 [Plakobranchus ocellatus]